ncbi:metallophosphoesterase [Candidatus Peregrinibacteria bacterium]|nr:metallophosphoesterase [Candidatus Peregrinibacteria bacterium]
MPFQEAKKTFETKTEKAPAKVEGNWTSFKTDTKNYFDKKQQEVADYIDKTNYPDKNKDKSDYLSAMKTAIDDVIDGNEATKNEIAQYKSTLRSKSEKLKQKFAAEYERQVVESEFKKTDKIFSGFGFKINVKDNAKTYLSVAKDQRIPVKEITQWMQNISSKITSPELKKALVANKNTIYTIFNHLCWGNKTAAENETKPLLETLKFLNSAAEIKEKTGIKNIHNVDLIRVLYALEKTGVKKERVIDYFIDGVAKLRQTDKDSFETILKGNDSKDLAAFLLASIIAIKEGKTSRSLEGIKLTMQIESATLKEKSELKSKSNAVSKMLVEQIWELHGVEFQGLKVEKKTKTEADRTRLEKEIAHSNYSLVHYRKDIILAEVKQAFANTYINKKGVNPVLKRTKEVINEILTAKDGDKLKILSLQHKIALPPQNGLLTACEIETEIAEKDYNIKKWQDSEDVRRILSGYYKNGKLDSDSKNVLKLQLKYRAEEMMMLIENKKTNIEEAVSNTKAIFSKYPTIKNIPPNQRQVIIQQLIGNMLVLKNIHNASVQLVSNSQAYAMLLPEGKEKQDILKKTAGYKKEANSYGAEINKIAVYLGHKEDKNLTDVDNLAADPILTPMLQREMAPHLKPINENFQSIVNMFEPISNIGKTIDAQMKQYPGLVSHSFEQGIAMLDNCASKMVAGRYSIVKTIQTLTDEANKGSADKTNMPEFFRIQRNKYIKQLAANLTALLNKPPYSTEAIKNMRSQREKIAKQYSKYIKYGFLKGVVIAAIFAAAVATAVGGGWALGALGGKLMASGMAAGALTSKIAVGGMALVGASAGGVLGARGAMSGLQALDFADFGGYKKIWGAKEMWKDFSKGYLLSIATVGTANALVKSLSWAGRREGYVALRWPGLAKHSRHALAKLENVAKFADPATWFKGGEGGEAATRQAFLKQFANEAKQEIAQETFEETAEKANPVLGFLVSVAGSLKSPKGKLAIHGLRPKKIGISIEGDSMVFTTKTPQEFVANFNKENIGQPGLDYKLEINPDNSVTLTLNSEGKWSVIDINPAMQSSNLTPEIEIARVPGLLPVNITAGKYKVKNPEQGMAALADFYNRGFNIVKTDTGTIKVSKGDKSIEIQMSAETMTQMNINSDAALTTQVKKRSVLQYLRDNAAKIKQYFSKLQIRRAFEEYVNKWKGNYAKFLENNPRLAKLMPKDLQQVALLGMAVISSAIGVPLALGLVQRTQDFEYSEGQRLYVRLAPGDFRYLDVRYTDPANKLVYVYDWTYKGEVPYYMESLNQAMAQQAQDQQTAQDLAMRLKKIGMDDIALDIASLENDTIKSEVLEQGTPPILTIDERKLWVEYFEQAHKEITDIAQEMHRYGYKQEASSLMNYNDRSRYPNVQTRLDDGRLYMTNINDMVKKLGLEKIDYQIQNTRKILEILRDNFVIKFIKELSVKFNNNINNMKLWAKKNWDKLVLKFRGLLSLSAVEKLVSNEAVNLELNEYKTLSENTALESQDAYEASLDKVLEALKGQNGIVQLRKDIPTILVQDLHGRREALVHILLQKGPDGRTNLEKMQNGELQIVLMGDAMHVEGSAKDRWQKAQNDMFDNKPSQAMTQEMVDSLNTMKIVMDLTAKYPNAFYYLKGNHDNIDGRSSGGDSPFEKYNVMISHCVKHWIVQNYGQEFLSKWAQFEKNLPLLAIGNNFVASHSEPGNTGQGGKNAYEIRSLNEIANRDADAVWALTWSRTEQGGNQARRVLELAGLDPSTAHYIVGHTHTDGKYEKVANRVIRINNHDEVHYGIIPSNGLFNPDLHIYKAEKPSAPDVKNTPTVTPQDQASLSKVLENYEYNLSENTYIDISNPQGIVELKLQDFPLHISPNSQYGFMITNPNDPANQFQALRDGETVVLGRENPGRFNFPETVSRPHIQITRQGDNIQVRNISTFGSTIRYAQEK